LVNAVDLGFCLAPADQTRLREAPPLDPDTFTDAVFVAERWTRHCTNSCAAR
jgi:hypothetical protein